MFNLYYNAFNKELMNIILLGYMGVGKSLIGQHLSSILNQKFIDLDEYIETKKSNSIHDIFRDSRTVIIFLSVTTGFTLVCDNATNF